MTDEMSHDRVVAWPSAEQFEQLDALRAEGHVVVLKLDGQRRDDPGNPDYTAAILGVQGFHNVTLRGAVADLLRSRCWEK
jgi:hypothetical protein